MINDLPDSLFKLRLTGPLRARLEKEAAKRGLTLTAEILRRIDDSFSDTSERVHILEKLVLDGEAGNNALSENVRDLERRMAAIEEKTYDLGRHWKD